MAKITKRDYAEAVDGYLLEGVELEQEDGRWIWYFRDETGEMAQPDRRTFKDGRSANVGAICWLKDNDRERLNAAKQMASDWMRHNNHQFY